MTLRLELNYKGNNYKIIYLEDKLLFIGDLTITKKDYNEIKVLEKSIFIFIILYRYTNILYNNFTNEILE
jgi:hypothetical protein